MQTKKTREDVLWGFAAGANAGIIRESIIGREYEVKQVALHVGFFVLAAAALLAAGCGDPPTGAIPYKARTGEPVPVFKLVDVNPNSATYDRTVSPRDYLKKVSAWYFGSAT